MGQQSYLHVKHLSLVVNTDYIKERREPLYCRCISMHIIQHIRYVPVIYQYNIELYVFFSFSIYRAVGELAPLSLSGACKPISGLGVTSPVDAYKLFLVVSWR